MNKRLIFRISNLLMVVVLSAMLTNCASLNAPQDTRSVTIAVVEDNSFEADGSINRQSIYAGVSLAASQIRERGGIDIQISVYDDEKDTQKTRETANQIASSNAVAVIGYSSIDTLEAAAEIYENAGIPTLNISPITGHFTESYYYHFNTAYTVESEAAYIANYLRKVNGSETATVISTPDSYSQTLARKFKNTFQGLGGTITIEKIVGEDTAENIISDIVSADTAASNPGAIFIATDDATAAELVILMTRKGVSYPIAGGSNLSSAIFRERIESQPEEISFPGYYTDGILATRAIIFDSANRYANQFLDGYQTAYASRNTNEFLQPDDRVVNGYDAALTLLAAMQNGDLSGSEIQAQADREKIARALAGMNALESSAQGVIGPVYFEPSQNIQRAPRFGIYQNGELVSASIQFEPVVTLSEVKDLAGEIGRGRVLTVDGEYVYRSNVVYVGIDLLGIDDIDIKTSTYKMDFYLWFRYRSNEQDTTYKPEDFFFTNTEGEFEITPLRDEEYSDGTVLKTYRVSGTFKDQFQFHEYPFDRQTLTVELRNQNATTSFIQYVVDRVGMRYQTEADLLANFRGNGAFESLFGWNENAARMTQDAFPTTSTLGSPQNFDRSVATNFSLINLEVDLERDSLQYIVKSLLPLLITLLLAYITFFLPLGHSERLTVGSTALLTTAFFHLTLADALPEIGYTVAMEYLFYASYVMSALIVLLETLSSRLEKGMEEAKKKSDKSALQNQRHKLDMFGRIAYPTILIATLVVGFFVYKGSLQLGPEREASSNTLLDAVVKSSASVPAAESAGTSSTSPDNEVILTLSTWRPEDTEEIQSLLDEFEAYALESAGKTITVNYRPVMSVNYDSIIDIELGRGEGPDLLYVRPFSVDGNIVRYLTPLDDVLPLRENFDETKLTPWTNSAFGLTYAVPFVGVVQGIYYNKDIFDKYFLEAPTTWEEFKITLSALKFADENLIPIANALNQNEDSEMFMSIAANFLGGPEGRQQLMMTDGTSLCYDDNRVVRIFQAIEDLKPYLPENVATINSQTSKELFLQGKAAMLFGGSWDLQTISKEAFFNWGVFAVPAPFLNRTYVIFQPDIGIGINRATQHPEEAKLFLEWLMSPEAINLMAQKLPGFYPLRLVEITPGANPNDAKFLNLVYDYPTDIRWMYTEISSKSPGALEIIRRALYEMMAFSLTPQEAASQLQAGLGEWYEPAQSCK
jgi:branched-chain amino acid transport system substrate-binding protein